MDIQEILKEARHFIEKSGKEPYDSTKMKFIRLKNGYRIFNPSRGMEYIIDLEYHKLGDNTLFNSKMDNSINLIKRIHLCRPIYSAELLNTVFITFKFISKF